VPRWLRGALIGIGVGISVLVGLVVVAVVVLAAIGGKTVDPTDPVNYPHCSTVPSGHFCKSP
jgi:hypothetical protein